MRGTLLTFFWVVAIGAALGAMTWHLAFRLGTQMPDRLIAASASEFEIAWTQEHDAEITLTDAGDMDVSMGVAHGLGRPWLMALYRQAATGRLAEWFGAKAVPFDRHVRRIGIPATAEQTQAGLSPTALSRMDSYAAGVQSAQEALAWDMLPTTVEMPLGVEAWAPRHSVAIERLLSWLSTDLPAGVSPGLDSLRAAQFRLAQFLGLHGMARAAVWTTERHGLYARLIVGDSGIPPIMTLSIRATGGLLYEGGTFPGVPYPFCGHSETAAWCKPFGGIATTHGDSLSGEPQFFSIAVSDGSKYTGSRLQHGDLLAVDSMTVRWGGFASLSDAASWFDLPNPDRRFQLADATGLAVTATLASGTTIRRLGTWAIRAGSATMSSVADEAPSLADRINAVDDTLVVGSALLRDTGVTLLDSVILEGFQGQTASYLRNWDRRYSASSIAASVYDLIAAYPDLAAEDSLSRWFGSDALLWRWELDPALQLRYPGTNLADPANRYGPTQVLRNGHPTSPAWGASRVWPSAGDQYLPETAWEAFLGFGPKKIAFRRPLVPYEQFLGRYRASPVRPVLQAIGDSVPRARTRVKPAS